MKAANEILDAVVEGCGGDALARLSILEAISCRHSGLSLHDYYEVTGYLPSSSWDERLLADLQRAIEASGIQFSLALSALARIEETKITVKRNGSYYTDFRLAENLAENLSSVYDGGLIVDPACGTSIVLAACVECLALVKGVNRSRFVADNIYGVDLSPLAVRGSILALSSYLQNISDLNNLVNHFAVGDSLDLGNRLPKLFGLDNFAFVIGNPPWERVRPSRNEYAHESGINVTYGSEIRDLPAGYERHRSSSRLKSQELAKKYNLKGGIDLYRAFLSLSFSICSDGGSVALFLPAGIIRSKSLAPVRNSIVTQFGKASFSVFTNSAKYFQIDSRFKFVLAILSYKNGRRQNDKVAFRYCSADSHKVIVESQVLLDTSLFNDTSCELGSPEVKTGAENRVLQIIWNNGTRMKEHSEFAGATPVRELDMTLNKRLFKNPKEIESQKGMLPLIEGRMISQYRCGCKRYVSGAGRSAKWSAVPFGENSVVPQFCVDQADLDPSMSSRAMNNRIGFCDIAGQTNERAMQAAFVPAGCVCGNKVPTILFEDTDAAMLWLGIVNSFVFDWAVRRYITTTINYFILLNLPFPKLSKSDKLAKDIIQSVKKIYELEDRGISWNEGDFWQYATERAKIDAAVFSSYGLSTDDLNVVLSDFPLVDQMNRRYFEGSEPTVMLLRAYIAHDRSLINEAFKACESGALPYVPNEYFRGIINRQ